MVTLCINNIRHFNFQLTHTTLKNVDLLKHASQVTICSHNTDKVLYEFYVSTLNQVCNFS